MQSCSTGEHQGLESKDIQHTDESCLLISMMTWQRCGIHSGHNVQEQFTVKTLREHQQYPWLRMDSEENRLSSNTSTSCGDASLQLLCVEFQKFCSALKTFGTLHLTTLSILHKLDRGKMQNTRHSVKNIRLIFRFESKCSG